MEVWKNIKEVSDYYQVSNYGNVRSVDRVVNNRNYKGTIIKPMLSYGGYYQVQLRVNIKKYVFSIHRLVAMYFVENDDEKLFVNHKNENKLDNHFNNLEWVTKSENSKHSCKKGGYFTRKFNYEQIKEIREMYNKGFSIYKIGNILNENTGTINNIVKLKTYK
jgi:hypothetical protein